MESAEKEAKRLVEHFQCNIKSRALDIGCGLGRLPIGILIVNFTQSVEVDGQSGLYLGKMKINRFP